MVKSEEEGGYNEGGEYGAGADGEGDQFTIPYVPIPYVCANNSQQSEKFFYDPELRSGMDLFEPEYVDDFVTEGM
jgi:hypothetical protein